VVLGLAVDPQFRYVGLIGFALTLSFDLGNHWFVGFSPLHTSFDKWGSVLSDLSFEVGETTR